MYKHYNDLTEEEKSELRDNLWSESVSNYGYSDYDYLSAEEQKMVDNANQPEDIPESVMLSAYGGYSFTEEDFMCNL